MRTWDSCVSVRGTTVTVTVQDTTPVAPLAASRLVELTSADIDALIVVLQTQQKSIKTLAAALGVK